ncbi:hypothetical protein [Paenibacillus oryzisoli]|uniref:Uncharacterized protein n=1 Tax=Paenibacillus oryzisoli TaxID=1850517 RepID=A0A198A8L2_9BACL|nr:hypothetical protein [Paenibacillus oryzisoli]OAS17411.1 hypothetical protein A8708_21810 [Paenibacillus oryzisoli]
MAICLEFKLVAVRGTVAEYSYGNCLRELDGAFEVDLHKLVSGETSMNTPMDEVVKRKNDNQSQSMANRVFGKIYKHYLEHYEYLSKGGYYA